MHDRLRFSVVPGRVTRALSWIAGALLMLHMVTAYAWADGDFLFLTEQHSVSRSYLFMFDLDEEEGFGTWYAAATLLLAGRLLLLAARDSRSARDGLWGWWMGLAVGFHCLSVDEVVGLHEFLNSDTWRELVDTDHAWTTYGLVAASMVGAAYLPFLVQLWKRQRRRLVNLLVVAGLLYVGGAVVVERIGPESDFMSMEYNLGWISLEEGLEMAGVILLIHAVLEHLRGPVGSRLLVEIGSDAPSAPSAFD